MNEVDISIINKSNLSNTFSFDRTSLLENDSKLNNKKLTKSHKAKTNENQIELNLSNSISQVNKNHNKLIKSLDHYKEDNENYNIVNKGPLTLKKNNFNLEEYMNSKNYFEESFLNTLFILKYSHYANKLSQGRGEGTFNEGLYKDYNDNKNRRVFEVGSENDDRLNSIKSNLLLRKKQLIFFPNKKIEFITEKERRIRLGIEKMKKNEKKEMTGKEKKINSRSLSNRKIIYKQKENRNKSNLYKERKENEIESNKDKEKEKKNKIKNINTNSFKIKEGIKSNSLTKSNQKIQIKIKINIDKRFPSNSYKSIYNLQKIKKNENEKDKKNEQSQGKVKTKIEIVQIDLFNLNNNHTNGNKNLNQVNNSSKDRGFYKRTKSKTKMKLETYNNLKDLIVLSKIKLTSKSKRRVFSYCDYTESFNRKIEMRRINEVKNKTFDKASQYKILNNEKVDKNNIKPKNYKDIMHEFKNYEKKYNNQMMIRSKEKNFEDRSLNIMSIRKILIDERERIINGNGRKRQISYCKKMKLEMNKQYYKQNEYNESVIKNISQLNKSF